MVRRAFVLVLSLAGLGVVAAGFLSGPPDGNVKLNDPLALGFLGEVKPGFRVSPDGSWIVYVADQDTQNIVELYSAPVGGGVPVKLNAPLVDGGDVRRIFQISPDSSRVVYAADQEEFNTLELYSVPIDGSAAPTKLNAPLVVGGDVVADTGAEEFFVASDSSRVVYRADQEIDGVDELYSVPLDGSAAPIKLNVPPLLMDGDVADHRISPDASRVVYTAYLESVLITEIYSVPLDGSLPSVKLNGVIAPTGDVREFAISPDSARVVYRADQDTLGTDELYGAPIDGAAAAVKLNGALVASGEVQPGFQITPDSGRVVYLADQDTFGVQEIYTVPIDGSLTAVKLNDALVPGGDVLSDFEIAGDSSRVAYVANQDSIQDELYSVPVDRSLAPTKLNATLVPGGEVTREVLVTPDGSRAVYKADQDTFGVVEVYSVPMDGSSSPVKLSGTMTAGGSVGGQFQFNDALGMAPDGSRVVYLADQDTDDVEEIYGVPVDGSAAASRLNGTLVPGGDVATGFVFSPDSSRLFYRATQDTFEALELFEVPLAGGPSTKVNLPPAVTLAGDVVAFQLSPDETTVVYLADQDVNESIELYAVPVDGSSGPIQLNDPLVFEGGVIDFAISSDSTRVVYRADQEQVFRPELYSVPIDGTSSPVRLSDPPPGPNTGVLGFEIAPDGSRVVYRAVQDVAQAIELYSVPIDGSQPNVRINALLTANLFVLDFAIAPDGGSVVYISNERLANVDELFVVPLDGSEAPVRLSGPLAPTGDVTDFRISPDSARVVYGADQDSNEVFEVYSVPIDGSSAAVKLNGSPAFGGDVIDYAISSDSACVVYRADQDTNNVNELYTVPIDASSSAVKLNAPLVGNLFLYEVSPDASRVVYRAAQETAAIELFGVPIDASAGPVKLSGPFFAGAAVNEFAISPDSSRVVFRGDLTTDNQKELYAAPLDGSSAPITLSGTLIPEGDVQGEFVFSGDGSRVAYLADADVNNRIELFLVPQDASLPPTRVNGPFVSGGDALEAFATGDGGGVVYRADQDTDETVELYATAFELAIDRVRPGVGPAEGGNTVTITGCAFESTTQVSFGGIPATSVEVMSSTELRAELPPSAGIPRTTKGPGTGKLRQGRIEGVTVDVVLSNGGTQATLSGGYTYLPIR